RHRSCIRGSTIPHLLETLPPAPTHRGLFRGVSYKGVMCMVNVVHEFWNDDRGITEAIEWVFWVTIAVIGIVTGMVAVRQAVISELTEFAQAAMPQNQSFSFSGKTNCESSTAGSSASDTTNTISERSVAASTANISQPACD